MRELSLFSGAGGGLLASLLLGWTTVGYVEFNDYCQRVLAQRIRDGHLHNAPIFGDIRAFLSEGYAERYRGVVDVVSAGFPCQSFSTAGQRRGADDPRNMWPQTADVLRVVRPRCALLENVPGLLAGSHGYFGEVLGELAELGYDARWCVLGAADVGAPHLRKRLWIVGTAQGGVADAERDGLREQRERRGEQRGEPRTAESGDDGEREFVAHTDRQRRKGEPRGTPRRRSPEDESGSGGEVATDAASPGLPDGQGRCARPEHEGRSGADGSGWWNTQPDVGRVAHGVASRVDRLKALGNGQVPAVAATAWRLLSEGLEE